MYKQLKKQLDDRDVIKRNIKVLEDRIVYIIQSLGLKGTSYSDIKICMIGNNNDKFADAFAKVEELDKEKELLIGEKKIIDDFIDDVCKTISKNNNVEQQVFKCRYILGLSRKDTAKRLGYTEDGIKKITKEILKKM